MRTVVVAFFLSMITAAILTPAVRAFALRFGLLDHALSRRKIHGRPVPRLGGIAIVAGFFLPLVGFLFFRSEVGRLFLAERDRAVGLFLGGLLIALLGVFDDVRGAGARIKFLVQFAVAGLVYHLGFRIDAIANPFGEAIVLGWVGMPFTLLWIVGVINAMNLIDGLDGLAGGVALVAVVTTFVVGLQRGNPLMLLFCAALAGSILGFLFYNFNPASIFMGDTGSMFLGFVLATSAIQTNQKSSTAVAVMIPTIALGLPILDTLLAMSRRAMQGRPLFKADKEHIHHRLLAAGLTQRQAVLVLYACCVVLGVVSLVLTLSSSIQAALLLVALGIVTFLLLRRLGYMRFQPTALSDQRRRGRALRASVRALGERLRLTKTPQEIWQVVRDSAEAFEADCVRLQLTDRDSGGDKTTTVFSSGFEDTAQGASGTTFTVRFNVVCAHHDDGVLELGWRDGRKDLDRDTEIAVELLCDDVAQAHERLKQVDREVTERARVIRIGER